MQRYPASFLSVLLSFFLVALIGAAFVVETRKEYNSRTFNAGMREFPESAVNDLIRSATAILSESKRQTNAKQPFFEDKMVSKDLEGARQSLSALDAFFLNFGPSNTEKIELSKAFSEFGELITEFQQTVQEGVHVNDEVVAELEEMAIHMIQLSSEISEGVHDFLVDQIELNSSLNYDDDVWRRLLLLGAILWSLLLLVVLYTSSRRYVQNVRHFEAAEHYSALFAASLQSASVGIMIRDMRTEGWPVIYVNKVFTDMTGYDLLSASGKTFDFLFGWYTDQDTSKSLMQAAKQGKSGAYNMQLYRKDGSTFWGEWRLNPLKDKEGELTHYVCILTDISDIRQTQEALRLAKEQAERASAVKTNFLTTMSHEIRTPMNGLLGVLDLLGDTHLLQEQKKLLGIAVTSSRALQEIINDILDYSKIEAGKVSLSKASFHLNRVLGDVIELVKPLAINKNLDIKTECDPALPNKFIGDSGRLRQILLNLLTNAIKFTDQGFVSLQVKSLLTQDRDNLKEMLLRFDVVDTGIGISSVDKDKLFQEFSQIESTTARRFGGTGLGLAISRRLVGMMGGEIGVESRPAEGSKFWFMIPLTVDSSSQNDETQKPTSGHVVNAEKLGRDKRILLVEDNETNSLVACHYLDKAGYSYDSVATGEEAVKRTREKEYGLIMMDISMPGMDGFEATRQIRSFGGWAAEVPIIALTAHVMEGIRERCLAGGMNDHIGKPLIFEELCKKLEIWTNKKEGNFPGDSGIINMAAVEAAFDPATLKGLVDTIGVVGMMRVTQAFLDAFDRQLEHLTTNRGVIDLNSIEASAHSLKGASLNCGLIGFASLVGHIEKAASEKDGVLAQSLLAKVDKASVEARRLLQKEIELYRDSSIV